MDTALNPHNISTHTNAAHSARVMSQRGGTRSFAAVLVSYPLLAKMQLNWGVVNKAWRTPLIKRQSICIWYNDCLAPMDQYRRIVNWPIWIELQLIWTKECNFHTIKMNLKLSFAKWQWDCLGLNELDLNWHSTGPYPLKCKNVITLRIYWDYYSSLRDLWTHVARFRVFLNRTPFHHF